jgi:hypothetical protein
MRKASTSAPLRLSPKPLSDNAFRVTAIAQPLEPLRKIRNLIIFRKTTRKCATIRSAHAVPRPCPSFFCPQFFCPHSLSFVSFVPLPVPDHCHSGCRHPISAHLGGNGHPASIIQPSPATPEKCNRIETKDFHESIMPEATRISAHLPHAFFLAHPRQ